MIILLFITVNCSIYFSVIGDSPIERGLAFVCFCFVTKQRYSAIVRSKWTEGLSLLFEKYFFLESALINQFVFVCQRIRSQLCFFVFLSPLVSFESQDDVRNDGDRSDSDIEIMFEQQPTLEQAELARKLMLPSTFFNYKNKPGYVSDESDGKSLLHFDFVFFMMVRNQLLNFSFN